MIYTAETILEYFETLEMADLVESVTMHDDENDPSLTWAYAKLPNGNQCRAAIFKESQTDLAVLELVALHMADTIVEMGSLEMPATPYVLTVEQTPEA